MLQEPVFCADLSLPAATNPPQAACSKLWVSWLMSKSLRSRCISCGWTSSRFWCVKYCSCSFAFYLQFLGLFAGLLTMVVWLISLFPFCCLCFSLCLRLIYLSFFEVLGYSLRLCISPSPQPTSHQTPVLASFDTDRPVHNQLKLICDPKTLPPKSQICKKLPDFQ